VAAPADLLAEVTIASPDATWQRLQRGVGGAAGILPSTLGGVLVTATGVDPSVGLEIDGRSAAYGVVAGSVGAPSWVLAARLVDARRVRASFEAETSRFDVHTSGDLEVATPKGAGTSPAHSLGLALTTSGWLVVGDVEASLTALAPYATRSLPARARPPEDVAVDVPRAALAGALHDAVAAEWSRTQAQMRESDRAQREAHGGRPPDFADPTAIVAVMDAAMQGRLAVLADLAGAHLGVTIGDAEVHVTATAPAASQSGAAASALGRIASGDLAPLAGVTDDATAAILVRSSLGDADGGAVDYGAAFAAALGPRLDAAGAKRVHDAASDWSRSSPSSWTAAVVGGAGPGAGVVADAQVADPKAAAHAVREAVDALTNVPALREPLATWLGVKDVKVGAVALPGGGTATLATFVRSAPPRAALAWLPGANDLRLALAEAPAPLLAPAAPGHALGDDAATRAGLSALGEASGALVLRPGRAGCEGAKGAVFLAWGKREAGGVPAAWASFSSSDSALRCVAKAAF
jgi:hypothetical protein